MTNKVKKICTRLAEEYGPGQYCFLMQGKCLIIIGEAAPGKTHPRNLRHPYRSLTKHAEMDAILGVVKNGLSVRTERLLAVNIRVRKDYSFGMAKPCRGCQDVFQRAGIRDVAFTTDCGWGIMRI